MRTFISVRLTSLLIRILIRRAYKELLILMRCSLLKQQKQILK
nr:MAG TPA: hypothetical protein [Caudoviricetes sp.]